MVKEQEAYPHPQEAQFDLHLSLAVAEKMDISFKGCWGNALTALRKRKDLQALGGRYVEGWALLSMPVPVEHGWVRLEDNRIVDPTYALTTKINLFKNPVPVYFEGASYTVSDLKGIPVAKLPHVWTYGGWGGFEYAPYMEAYKKAFFHATGVSFDSLHGKLTAMNNPEEL